MLKDPASGTLRALDAGLDGLGRLGAPAVEPPSATEPPSAAPEPVPGTADLLAVARRLAALPEDAWDDAAPLYQGPAKWRR